MKKTLLIYLLVVLQSCMSFERLSKSKEGDGSVLAKEQYGNLIKKYSSVALSEDKLSDSLIYELNSSDISRIFSSNENYNWLICYASWCPHAYVSLKYTNNNKKLLNNNNITLTYISQDYQISNIKKYLSQINYQGLAFVLDADYFGTDNIVKNKKMVSEITNGQLQNYRFSTVQHFLFDKNNTLIFYKTGDQITIDTIAKYIPFINQ